jgi:transposase
MHTADKHDQFIQLRVEGQSFDQIAAALKVTKPTLIEWSRKHRHEIANLLVIRKEQLLQRHLATLDSRLDQLAEQLKAAEAEFARRDLTTLTTAQLLQYIASLKRQMRLETGPLQFTATVDSIPEDEYADRIQIWNA